jgi:glycosyltransferase involved in cell wall biosynthesis
VPDADLAALPRLRGRGGRPLRVAHLTTVDMSLSLLLRTELQVDVEAGFDVFGLSTPGPYVADVTALGVTHVPLPALTRAWDPRRDLAAARELASVLRTLDLDVLHTHNPKTGVLGRILGRLARVPVVVNTCHGLWLAPADRRLKKLAVLGAEAIAGRFSHAELYQNDTDRATLSRWVRRQRTVGNGVDLVRFRPDPVARVRVRAELGVGPDELLVGGVGRLVAEKGLGEYAATARVLAGRARFVWVGPADDDKPDAVADVGAAVSLLGLRSDMEAVYSALDVFVLPSYREGFSRSGMEAAACGVASVLTDIRGCREVGDDGGSLLLVPPRDAPALTGAVSLLLDDVDLRARLGAAARAKALAEFDQRAVARVSIETYAGVARRRGLAWEGL